MFLFLFFIFLFINMRFDIIINVFVRICRLFKYFFFVKKLFGCLSLVNFKFGFVEWCGCENCFFELIV